MQVRGAAELIPSATAGGAAHFRDHIARVQKPEPTDWARLRQFMGTRGRRKFAYAPVLVNALPLEDIPAPLANLIAAI